MTPLINIHSHREGGANEITIRNVHELFTLPLPDGYFSAGIHPRFVLKQTYLSQFDELSLLAQKPSVVAIGECGLDHLCETDFSLQEEIFALQVQLANKINKPLIIHCVRAFEEVMASLKRNSCEVPVVWHGYSKKSAHLASEILKAGHYFSFGTNLFKETMHELFRTIPDDRYFLETDDDKTTIFSIYEQAAKIKNYSLDYIADIIQKNTKQVFKTINF